jgi:hypothetical protein
LDEAVEQYRVAEDLARGSGNRDSEIWCMLGQASALLQLGEAARARATISRARRIASEPGFEHPLETAHLGLLDALADVVDGLAVDEGAVLGPYAQLGIEWPRAFLSQAVAACKPVEAIPI